MAATVYCTTNTAFLQHSLTTSRAQFSPVLRRTSLLTSTSFSPTAAIPSIEQQSLLHARKSDENNNDNQMEDTREESLDGDLPMTIDDTELNDDIDEDEYDTENLGGAEELLSLVGLRLKMRQRAVTNLTLRPLTQRLASPVCLLPLPKYSERVRQALYVRLPFLKFLTTTCDIDSFCSTDASAKAQSLLPRSTAQTRALSSLCKSQKKRKLPKTDFISMAVATLRHPGNKISMNTPVHSALRCYVVLDRLKQSTIDQIMQSSSEDIGATIASLSTLHRLSQKVSPPTHHQSLTDIDEQTTTRTTITTMTTEKTVVKRKSITTVVGKSKRFKAIENDRVTENNTYTATVPPSLTYQRIYLKCFLCSKRSYVDAWSTESDVLHSHWLEHGGKLLLNIYDTEIDSVLTRVVEFFKSPKQQLLEGKVKTIFILNSKEIKSTRASSLPPNDSYIVID